MDNTMIEVKFATRFDSPACLDIYDDVVTLVNKTLTISAMCRNDKKLLKYELSIELFEDVQPFSLPEQNAEAQKVKMEEYEAALEKYRVDNETYQKEFKEYEDLLETYRETEGQAEPEEPTEPTPPVKPEVIEPSYFKMESVGRLYLNLTKVSAPKRWRRLLA